MTEQHTRDPAESATDCLLLGLPPERFDALAREAMDAANDSGLRALVRRKGAMGVGAMKRMMAQRLAIEESR